MDFCFDYTKCIFLLVKYSYIFIKYITRTSCFSKLWTENIENRCLFYKIKVINTQKYISFAVLGLCIFMKTTFFIFGILLSSIAFSQDVVIFVQAKYEDNPIGLDTIYIENLSNGTSAELYNLPMGITNYEINLSKGAQVNAITQLGGNESEFTLLSNHKGFCSFQIISNSSSSANFELYNIRGQKLYHENRVLVQGINTFEFSNTYTDMGILKITTTDNSYSIKVIGEANSPTFLRNTDSEVLNANLTAKETFGFVFNEGDTLRMTAKKHAYHSNSLFLQPKYNLNYTENYTIYLSKPCTGNETVTDCDGNIYNTVKIGNQCWMKENLNVTHYSEGTPLVKVSHPDFEWWVNTDLNVFYNYGNNESTSEMTGILYPWRSAINIDNSEILEGHKQGVCPSGWHIPTVEEWVELVLYADSEHQNAVTTGYFLGSDVGINLKSTLLWENTFGGTDKYGLSVLPAGGIVYEPLSHNLVFSGYYDLAVFWTFTQNNSPKYIRFNSAANIMLEENSGDNDPVRAASVRCIKD